MHEALLERLYSGADDSGDSCEKEAGLYISYVHVIGKNFVLLNLSVVQFSVE